jgi:hypothetical protein
MLTTRREQMTRPLRTVTGTFGVMLLTLVALLAVNAVAGRGFFLGFGRATLCVAQPYITYGNSGWTTAHMGFVVHPGALLNVNGSVQACSTRPGTGQRILYTLTGLPSQLVWAFVLFLLWRLTRVIGGAGPFTAPVAKAMRRLGWVILAGTAAAELVQALALTELLRTMVSTPAGSSGAAVAMDAVIAVVHAELPVAALVAAALLTFARIIGLGAEMDNELAGTV